MIRVSGGLAFARRNINFVLTFSAKEARVFYEAPTASICDICEGSDCGNDKCTIKAEEQRSSAVPENYFEKEAGNPRTSGCPKTTSAILGMIVSAVLARLFF